MSKPAEFLTAIHEAIAATLPTREQQYMMQLLLRQRRREFINEYNTSEYPHQAAFIAMHAPKGDEKYAEMFQGALADWEPGYRLALDIEYRSEPGAMLDPLIHGIMVRN